MRSVCLVNKSTLATDPDVEACAAALQVQVARDLVPAWGLNATVRAGNPSPGDWPLYLFDQDTDVASALGWHEFEGTPVGIVSLKTCLDYGDRWQATVSHELLEMLGDPTCQGACQVADFYGRRNCWIAGELADPVENDEYLVNGVPVSNFILPDWFRAGPAPGKRYDQMGRLTAPLTLSPGGYVLCYDQGRWQELFARRPPAHVLVPGRFSRRVRRQYGPHARPAVLAG